MGAPEVEDPAPPGWIARLIAACAGHPYLVVLVTLACTLGGIWAARHAPLDAIPDLSDTQVIVYADWMGRGPDLVEDQVTVPIVSSLLAAPKVKAVRGQSMFGMSFVYVIFDDGTDVYWARSRVMEYLGGVNAQLPAGVSATLGPDASGVGWVYQYALVDTSGTQDPQELRSLQDWTLRYALESVPGVAQVASIGGYVKQYQVVVDPDRLRALDVPLSSVMMAAEGANQEAGGRVIEIAEHETVIRARGYVTDPAEIGLAPLMRAAMPQAALGAGMQGGMGGRTAGATPDRGAPLRISDVAQVGFGPAQRRGIADLDGTGESVGAIVIMRQGENALDVIARVKARISEVAPSLPTGVEIVPTYDRSILIEAAVDTLRVTLIEELLVVSAIVVLFLLHVRSALVPIVVLPVAVVLAFIPMYFQGLTVNIMSLGGIAVAIGAMVDASIILVENIHKKLEAWEDAGRPGNRTAVIVAGMQEVGPSAFFALLVITVSFLPIFTLEATEGRLFKPLAYTKTWSMGLAALLAVTLTPALAVLFIRGRVRREEDNPLNRILIRLYAPVVRFVVRLRWAVIVAAILIVASTIPVWRALQSEFMPPLNEGVLLYMPSAPPGISEAEAARFLQRTDAELKAFPEVAQVFGKAGRAETPTDPAPLSMVETVVTLKPPAEWRPGMTWTSIINALDAKLQVPGWGNAWWMPIQTRTEMLSTGIRSPLGIKVFGDHIDDIEATAIDIERVLAKIPGTRNAFAERSTGGFFLDIEVDRVEAGRFGLSVKDVQDVVQVAIGGMDLAEVVEGRARYPMSVRYAREYRDDPEELGRVWVPTPSGAQVPLSRVAKVVSRRGPDMIRSEGGKLVGYVFADPGDRPIADYVEEARPLVSAAVRPPPGGRIEWAGQFEHLERAEGRLLIVIPLTLALVAMLLWLNTRSGVETAIVMLAVPFSAVGAVWLVWLLDYHMSVAVWVGMIALAGLDAETGVVMLLYLTLAHKERVARGPLTRWSELVEVIEHGAARRVRPKLMTVAAAMLGLVPVMWSDGTGADVMKRIAAPMIGGLVTSFVLELTIYPAIFAVWKGRGLARRGERADTAG